MTNSQTPAAPAAANTSPAATAARVTKSIVEKGRKAVEKNTRALAVLSVEYVRHDSLAPNHYNPNRQTDHDFELLCKSMEEDGFTQPIVAVRVTTEHLVNPEFAKRYEVGQAVIVDGEHRWRAATALGYAEIPVVFTPMTVEQMMTATLRHNRARGSEDIELAAAVLKDLQSLGALDHARDSLLLDDTELNRLLEDTTAAEGMAAEEFSEAWRPVQADDANTTKGVEVRSDAAGGTVVTAMTADALAARREQERRVAAAKTDEEKVMARQSAQFYRVHLTFAGEEADVVKRVLADEPAQNLLRLCKVAVDQPAENPGLVATDLEQPTPTL